MSDHYNLLGVPPDADAEALRRAYRRAAKRCHPDLNAHRPPAEREELQRRFIELTRAYQVLSHPAQRAAYDRQRAAYNLHGATERPSSRAGAPEQGTGPRPAASPPPRSGAARPASAAPRGGRARQGAEQEPTSPEVGRMRREAEQSLAAFGLDLRFPGEATLEQLLDWARGLYRDLAGAVRPGAVRPGAVRPRAAKPGVGRKSASAGARADTRESSAARGAPPPEPDRERRTAPNPPRQGGASSASAPSAAGPGDPAIEGELAQLKRDLRRGSGRAARAPTVDEELAELKRKHGRRPPR